MIKELGDIPVSYLLESACLMYLEAHQKKMCRLQITKIPRRSESSIHHRPMPRRLPIRPPRPSRSPFPSALSNTSRRHALVRKLPTDLESTSKKKLPPKIVALDAVPRIPLSPNPLEHERRMARIEQI